MITTMEMVVDPNNFLADPGPTTDLISLTAIEGQIGAYYLPCQVAGHLAMTGWILVVPEPSFFALCTGILVGGLLLLRGRRD